MTDREYLLLCYQAVLDREPAESELQTWFEAIRDDSLTREEILKRFVESDEFKAKSTAREPWPPGHFFSAIPSREDRENHIHPSNVTVIPGVDLNEATQENLFSHFLNYYRDCPWHESRAQESNHRYSPENFSFPFSDAWILHCFLRKFRPRRVIEIGSGHSSAALLDTIDTFFEHSPDCLFIEPYPELLHSLLRPADKQYRILAKRLQDVPVDTFTSLEENDILFIDSTHVSKLDSDVNFAFHQILPALKPGVLVHVHDIYWPFEYPIEWIREGRAWNEAYLVRAFLEFNSEFEILYFSSFIHARNIDLIRRKAPQVLPNIGGSLWLRRTATPAQTAATPKRPTHR